MNSNHDSSDANLGANQGCDKFADELSHLVLGELEPARAAAVEAHCASCASCRAERELLTKSAALIEADAPKLATVMRLSEAREQALLAQAATAGGLRQKFWTSQRLTAAAAAILAVCVTGNWLWRKYDRAPGRPGSTQGGMEVARREAAPVGSGAYPYGPDGARPAGDLAAQWQQKLDDAIDAGDHDVTKSTIDEFKKSGVQLKPEVLASLSVDLVQADNAEDALALLAQAPSRDELDVATAEKLRRVTDYVEKEAREEAAKRRAEAPRTRLVDLGALGYGGEGGIVEVTEEEFAAMQALGYAEADEQEAVPEPKMDQKNVVGGRKSGGAKGGQARPRPAAAPKEATPLSDADRAALRALGYSDDGESDGYSARQQTGNVLYAELPDEEREVLFKQMGGEELTVNEMKILKEARRKLRDDGSEPIGDKHVAVPKDGLADTLEQLGYAVGSDDEADATVDDLSALTSYDSPDVAIMRNAAAALAGITFHTPRDVATLEDQLRRAAADGRSVDVDALVKSFLERLAPRQGEAPRDMFFRWFGDNPAIPTRIDARSTFGMDVDTASYNLARGYLAKGTLPPKAAVRTEEFVNAFKQGLAAPAAAVDGVQNPDVFALTTELAPSPFGEGKHLLRVGLKAREIDRSARQPATLTFVIDVSGSMEEGGRLELVKQALRLLVAQLDERDSIAIVVFSENARIALPPTRASEQARILAALDPLRPEQSTNAGAGLRLGYDLAMTQRDRAGDHRVILCSDGVANAGVTDPDQLTQRIRQCKSERIYLTSVGVGMNNVNDALLEQLAREGDGACHYVDGLAEAKELFVDKLTGTLSTVARDAKIQVEFAPESVRAFRQLGYENRALAHADFRNDKVDAGEVGAGHEVVALYELDLAPNAAGPIATVHCRYEEPRSQTVREQARVCFAVDIAPTVAAASPHWRLDAAVAEFAELLRQSVHARDGSFGAIERLAEPLVAELADDKDVPEFVALVKQAARLPDLLPRRGELSRCVDELKKVRCWQQEFSQTDPAQQQANGDLMRQLEEQNRKLEQALRDALAGAARGR